MNRRCGGGFFHTFRVVCPAAIFPLERFRSVIVIGSMNLRFCVAGVILIAAAAGCVSRYRVALFMDADNRRRQVKVEQTQLVIDSRLGDPFGEQKILSGSNKCLVLMTSARGKRSDSAWTQVFAYDEVLKVRLFIELPSSFHPARMALKQRSFAQMLGRYMVPPEQKVFLPDTGNLVIDSLTKDHLYGTIGARFVNTKGEPLVFDGQFRARIRR